MTLKQSSLIKGSDLAHFIDQSFGSLYPLHVLPELEYTLSSLTPERVPYAHRLSDSGVLFIHPDHSDPIQIRSFNGVGARVSPQVLGVVSAIYAYGSLTFSNSAGLCLIAARCLRRIREDARSSPDAGVIQSLTT